MTGKILTAKEAFCNMRRGRTEVSWNIIYLNLTSSSSPNEMLTSSHDHDARPYKNFKLERRQSLMMIPLSENIERPASKTQDQVAIVMNLL